MAGLAATATADPRLTEPAIRAFLTRQEAAWTGKDARAFAATFTPDAVFVDQARNSNGGVTANGSSPLPQAIAQARRFFATAKFTETAAVDRVEIAPDGRSARVFSHQSSRVETPGRPARRLCAETQQTLVLLKGRILSKGQTDTDVRCPR
ncbi:MAG: hypothetical protein ACXU8S_00020 [Phenylobacterium sp.]